MKDTRTAMNVTGRREFLHGAASATCLALAGCGSHRVASRGSEDGEVGEHSEAEVTAGEDLMQEHGVMGRILLLYDEAARRIVANEALDLAVISSAAGIVRRFVEDYHERLEEQHVFPRLQAASRELDLVAILLEQHQLGRAVTDEITRCAGTCSKANLLPLLRGYTRMYRPHAAREDTVLFPAFRGVVGRAEYRELGELLEEREHAHFGKHGFAAVVNEVASLEETLGIHDLSQFTFVQLAGQQIVGARTRPGAMASE